jgi:AP endonuclease-1
LKKPKRARVTKESANNDFPQRQLSPWKVGAHVSSAGGVQNAVVNAAKIGCVSISGVFLPFFNNCFVTRANAFAIFLKSQRKWSSPDLTPSSIASFKERMQEFGYPNSVVLPHGSYLINLGNPDTYILQIQYQRHGG